MSSTRSRNKLCLSLDSSSNSTSGGHLSRWSEVVPPKTALTFAALWDPEEGMVTFSGAALLESESLSTHSDIFRDDPFSVDRDSDSTTSENTATLATFHDAFRALCSLHRTPWDSREHLGTRTGQSAPRCLQARASSTFDGLDVYSHDVQVKPRRSLQLSCSDLLDIESSFRTPSAFGKLRLRSDLMLNVLQGPEPEARESTAGGRPPNLKSRFSTTTTSTSNYVDVAAGAHPSARTSETLPLPDVHHKHAPGSPASSWPSLPQRRRLLRKRRRLDGDGVTGDRNSVLSTPRKMNSKTSMSALPSPSSIGMGFSSRTAAVREDTRRGRFPSPIASPLLSTPPASTSPSTRPSTPPATPSKGMRFKLRFSLLPRRKSRPSSLDSDGWVLIEVTPIIQQHFVADLDHE